MAAHHVMRRPDRQVMPPSDSSSYTRKAIDARSVTVGLMNKAVLYTKRRIIN